jgi:hypothetical protein
VFSFSTLIVHYFLGTFVSLYIDTQSALRQTLNYLSRFLNMEFDPTMSKDDLMEIRTALSNEIDYSQRSRFAIWDKRVIDCISNVVTAITRELGNEFDRTQSDTKAIDFKTYSHQFSWGLQHRLYPDKCFKPIFIGQATGSEYILFQRDNNQILNELFRFPLASDMTQTEQTQLDNRLRDLYVTGVKAILGKSQ